MSHLTKYLRRLCPWAVWLLCVVIMNIFTVTPPTDLQNTSASTQPLEAPTDDCPDEDPLAPLPSLGAPVAQTPLLVRKERACRHDDSNGPRSALVGRLLRPPRAG